MRTGLKILVFSLLLGCAIPSYAGNPTAYLNFASFCTPLGQNYFETYISVMGSSLAYLKNENHKYSAKAHVTLSFKKNDSLVARANFNILSPETEDSLTKPNFIDVHRFWLSKGEYTMVFTLDDPNDASHTLITAKQLVRVGYASDSVTISDAEFLSSYSPSNKPSPYNKCGYDMFPFVFTNYSAQVKKLTFYCEFYHTLKFTAPHNKISVQYSLETQGSCLLDSPADFSRTVQLDADSVLPFLAELPIDNLPTGCYRLKIAVMNKGNHILAKRSFDFTKDNPGVKTHKIDGGFAVYMQNRDTLIESIHCLAPISGVSEQAYVINDSLKAVPIAELKRFFYYFWQSRDSINPLEAWQKYLDKVMAVNNSFNVPGMKGYRTDRGRVYLQYGIPNQRTVQHSNPATYPYEIWQYNKLPDGQTNVKFVFYTTSVETNNYVLLHSTATGEIQNPHWQYALYGAIGSILPGNLDNSSVPDDLGEDVNDQFNNPH